MQADWGCVLSAEVWVGVIGVLVGMVSIAVAIALDRRRKRPSQLDYTVLSSASLLGPEAQRLREPLEITYEGLAMTDPWLTTVRISNTGKAPIVADQYTEPIRIRYAQNPPVSGYVSAASRDTIWPAGRSIWAQSDPEAELGGDGQADDAGVHPRVQMKPALLRSGEWFDVQLLSDGDPSTVIADTAYPELEKEMRKVPTPAQIAPFRPWSGAMQAAFAVPLIAVLSVLLEIWLGIPLLRTYLFGAGVATGVVLEAMFLSPTSVFGLRRARN